MAKSTRSKKTSWKAKAMGALALAAVFGLPMGTAMAADKPVENQTAWDNIFTGAESVYSPGTDKVTVKDAVTMSKGTLNVNNLILGATSDNLEDEDFFGVGDIAFADTKALTFTGGKIVANTITIGGNQLLNLQDEANVILRIAKDASQALGSISTQVLDYYSHMGLQIKNTTIQIADGGTFNFIPENFEDSDTGNAYDGSSLMGYTGSPATSWNSDLLMTGGTLNMDASGQPGYGRLIELSSVDITGGTVNIGGYYGTAAAPSTSTLYGDMGNSDHFTIGGTAKVNLYNYGTISTFRAVDETNVDMTLAVTGGEINMLATDEKAASTIRAASRQGAYENKAAYVAADSYGKLNISGGAINVVEDAFGVIMSRESTMTGGTINVDGGLTVAGGTNWDNGGGDVIDYINDVQYQWGEFTLDGGTINVNGTGRLVFYGVGGTGNDMVLNGGNGALNGKLVIKDITARASADAAEIAAAGQAVAETVKVLAGKKFTVSDLDLSKATAGSLTIDGSLMVNGTTAFGEDTAANAVALNDGGSLTAKFSDFLEDFETAKDYVQAALNITDTQDEKVKIYLTGNGNYTKDDLTHATAALEGSSGSNANLILGLLGGTMVKVDANGDPTEEPELIDLNDGGNPGASVDGTETITATNNAEAKFNTDEATVNGTLGVKTLLVENTSSDTAKVTQVTVDDLTLVGDGSTAKLIQDKNSNEVPAIKVAQDGSLNLGLDTVLDNQGGTVGNVTLVAGTGSGANTEMNVNKGTFEAGTIAMAANNELNVNNAALKAGNITVTGADSSISVKGGDAAASLVTEAVTFNESGTVEVINASLTADSIKGATNKTVTINVGDETAAGHLVAKEVVNGLIILDPAWWTDSTTSVLGAISDTSLAVLQNSWLYTMGAATEAEAEAWMNAQIPGGSLANTEGRYTAALAIVAPMTLGDDRLLTVDGDMAGDAINSAYEISNANKATFAPKSLFIVDAEGLRDSTGETTLAALKTNKSGGGTAIVDATAALKIVGAAIGDTVKVLDETFGTTDIIDGDWGLNVPLTNTAADTLLFDSKYISGTPSAISTGKGYQVKIEANKTAIADLGGDYPKLSGGMVGMFQDFLTNGYDAGSTNPAVRAFSELFNMSISGTAAERVEVARTIEGAARIAAVAGIPTLASGLGTQVSGLVVDHNSMLNAVQPAFGSEPGQIGLWLTPFYRSSDVDGMDAGHFENAYELNYGGAAFGLDYNVSEKFRLGLALNAGGGDSETQGGGNGFNKTENDFDFWGLSLYGSYSNGAFGLTADAGYTSLDNEITQDLPRFNDRLKASGGSDLFTLGLTGEYRVTTDGGFAVTPHAGLRYTSISTDDSLLKDQDSNRILDVSTDDQNLFQIPLGVKLGKDIVTDGGWTVTPSADLGVLFTMGDTDVDSKATISGTPYSGVTNTEVVDKAAFTGALGLQAKADNGLSLGLEYGLLASGNQTGHSVNGLLRFEF